MLPGLVKNMMAVYNATFRAVRDKLFRRNSGDAQRAEQVAAARASGVAVVEGFVTISVGRRMGLSACSRSAMGVRCQLDAVPAMTERQLRSLLATLTLVIGNQPRGRRNAEGFQLRSPQWLKECLRYMRRSIVLAAAARLGSLSGLIGDVAGQMKWCNSPFLRGTVSFSAMCASADKRARLPVSRRRLIPCVTSAQVAVSVVTDESSGSGYKVTHGHIKRWTEQLSQNLDSSLQDLIDALAAAGNSGTHGWDLRHVEQIVGCMRASAVATAAAKTRKTCTPERATQSFGASQAHNLFPSSGVFEFRGYRVGDSLTVRRSQGWVIVGQAARFSDDLRLAGGNAAPPLTPMLASHPASDAMCRLRLLRYMRCAVWTDPGERDAEVNRLAHCVLLHITLLVYLGVGAVPRPHEVQADLSSGWRCKSVDNTCFRHDASVIGQLTGGLRLLLRVRKRSVFQGRKVERSLSFSSSWLLLSFLFCFGGYPEYVSPLDRRRGEYAAPGVRCDNANVPPFGRMKHSGKSLESQMDSLLVKTSGIAVMKTSLCRKMLCYLLRVPDEVGSRFLRELDETGELDVAEVFRQCMADMNAAQQSNVPAGWLRGGPSLGEKTASLFGHTRRTHVGAHYFCHSGSQAAGLDPVSISEALPSAVGYLWRLACVGISADEDLYTPRTRAAALVPNSLSPVAASSMWVGDVWDWWCDPSCLLFADVARFLENNVGLSSAAQMFRELVRARGEGKAVSLVRAACGTGKTFVVSAVAALLLATVRFRCPGMTAANAGGRISSLPSVNMPAYPYLLVLVPTIALALAHVDNFAFSSAFNSWLASHGLSAPLRVCVYGHTANTRAGCVPLDCSVLIVTYETVAGSPGFREFLRNSTGRLFAVVWDEVDRSIADASYRSPAIDAACGILRERVRTSVPFLFMSGSLPRSLAESVLTYGPISRLKLGGRHRIARELHRVGQPVRTRAANVVDDGSAGFFNWIEPSGASSPLNDRLHIGVLRGAGAGGMFGNLPEALAAVLPSLEAFLMSDLVLKYDRTFLIFAMTVSQATEIRDFLVAQSVVGSEEVALLSGDSTKDDVGAFVSQKAGQVNLRGCVCTDVLASGASPALAAFAIGFGDYDVLALIQRSQRVVRSRGFGGLYLAVPVMRCFANALYHRGVTPDQVKAGAAGFAQCAGQAAMVNSAFPELFSVRAPVDGGYDNSVTITRRNVNYLVGPASSFAF